MKYTNVGPTGTKKRQNIEESNSEPGVTSTRVSTGEAINLRLCKSYYINLIQSFLNIYNI